MVAIKHRYTGNVICSFDVPTIKEAVVKAIGEGADLMGADLEGANLRGAYLGGANLGGAYLVGADVGSANLGGANLRGANLEGAYLVGANLRGANLRGAYLVGADVGSANLGGEKLAIAPVSIINLNWAVLITEGFMTIGCQRHTHEEWRAFDANAIARMHDEAPAFWKSNKTWLLASCKAHRKESLAVRKLQEGEK